MGEKRDSEAFLAQRIRNKDPLASKALYGAYAGYLTGVCTRYLSDPDDVKDVLHDSFLKIFGAMHSFEYKGPGSLKAWLTKIVVNESLRFIRDTYRHELVTLSEEIEMTAAAEEPEIRTVPMEILHRMISELPTGYRTVFNLYVFEGRSHKDISALLNIKEASSASQFHRAKALLAARIKEYQSNNP
ncbi:MAG: RNA polymerase sigma factor [Muribaculaceae bacterium]|nr:RNA polymerase sigma factor [Muribaculaceae bacterium]